VLLVSSATVAGSTNIIEDNANCPGAIIANPLLGPLQLNDGFTPTMAIPDGSVAIDAADMSTSPPFDQRGKRRPQGPASDIGAYERCVPVSTPKGFFPCGFVENPIFNTEPLITLANPSTGGTVTPPSGNYPMNSVQALTATPNPGFTFVNWAGLVGDPTNPSTFVAMDRFQVVTANFVGSAPCAANLAGRGTAGTAISAPRIDLTWYFAGAAHANVLRSATSGGPYAFVGTSTTTSFTDTTAGLVNNTRAYYVLQFFASTGVKMCDSNEVGVTVPRGR
jgi:hypothetical protein